MKNPVDKYVHDVTTKMTYIFARKKIAKELHNHLNDSIEYNVIKGLTKDEAIDKAIEEIGSAKDISDEFNKIYKSFHYLYNLFLLSLLILTSYTFIHFGFAYKNSRYQQHTLNIYEELDITETHDLNQEMKFSNDKFVFKKAYLTSDDKLIIDIKHTKINPFIRSEESYAISNNCNGKTCFISGFIPSSNQTGAVALEKNRRLFVVEDVKEIPKSISIIFESLNQQDYIKELIIDEGGL